MVKQERAACTRRTVVRAAAAEFDRGGYDGTSLQRICRAAGISTGALTFHFPTKDKIACAVQERGDALTRAETDRAVALPASPLRRARALVLAIARLLEKETAVRAAARLSRELPGGADWAQAWLPQLRGLLHQAHAEGQLRAATDPRTVTLLAAYLIAGVDAHLHRRGGARAPGLQESQEPQESVVVGEESPGPVEQLARVWDLVLYGVSPAGPAQERTQGPAAP
ncbi:TetR family transcriptional regulator [Streptomyces sp. URMC 124]|uniref:TetR family transcriptional regulator n=1 Tax=Streptomyces sp. URMC 124 TaxID=3423405 RepID=UPI003F1D103D